MVKQRMASADVAAEVACLKQRILGLRLANIYDLNSKVGCTITVSQLPSSGCMRLTLAHAQTYVLKLSKSGSDGDKIFLLLESGSRFHTVQVCAVAVSTVAHAGWPSGAVLMVYQKLPDAVRHRQ
jgi:hypothetical protein